jgi:hypothetical protein
VLLVLSLAACSSGHNGDAIAGSSTGARVDANLVPAAFLSYSGDGNSLVEWDSNGQQLRTVALDSTNDVSLSPDGTRLLVTPQGGDARILDVRGKELVRGVMTGTIWADDSRRLCGVQVKMHPPAKPSMAPIRATFRFLVIDPGRGTRVVPGQFDGFVGGPPGNDGPYFERCNVSEGSAFVDALPGRSQGRAEINLNTGRVTTPRWLRVAHAEDADTMGYSGDGHYAAEEVPGRGARIATQILDTSTGDAVAQIRGEPQGLSWSGHILLLYLPAFGGQLRLINWQTGAILWRGPLPKPHHPRGQPIYAQFSTVGNTDDLALFLSGTPLDSVNQVSHLYLFAGSKQTSIAAEARSTVSETELFRAGW